MSDWLDDLLDQPIEINEMWDNLTPERKSEIRLRVSKKAKQAIASKLAEAERLARLSELRLWEEAIKQGATHRSSLSQRISALETQAKEAV